MSRRDLIYGYTRMMNRTMGIGQSEVLRTDLGLVTTPLDCYLEYLTSDRNWIRMYGFHGLD